MESGYSTVIIDTGTSTIKAGLSSDMYPRVEIPTQTPEDYANEQARPIMERGIVTNWKRLEDVWSNVIYDKLGVKSPGEVLIYLTERVLNPKANREKMLQIMMEEFQFGVVSFNRNTTCSMIGSGRLSGTTLELGGGISSVVPIYDGYALPHAVQCLDVAGDDITEYLMSMLHQSGTSINRDIARNIKESTAYVSTDPEIDNSLLPNIYTLPDGRVVSISTERYKCVEPIFDPSLLGLKGPGIHQLIAGTYKRLESNNPYFRNLILSGGSSLFPGLQERLHRELASTLQPTIKPSYTILPYRKHLAFYGACIITSMSNFLLSQNTFSMAEYEESGPSLVHRKIY
ncbi:hypothetical protein LOD99_3392 [Oopsacas minuta]|uniref:Actin n=1 Tax=Oopsacas minuta TaxID=111878 RepID=A0AAV7JX40_9METZ|nr:hypothetical protein LOD99_3392 [Oopsacas minuta]